MDLLGDAFIYLRDTYIIPLIHTGIDRKKYSFWSLKTTLTCNIISLNYISKDRIEIEISEQDFLKSNLCEIELFRNKSIIQFEEYSTLKHRNSAWSFVSLYYFFFFTITTLMRILQRGFIYLNSSHVKMFEDYYLAVNSTPIKLSPGNYFYSVKGLSAYGNYIITLTNKGEGIHQLACVHMDVILKNEIIPKANSDEIVYYGHLMHLLNRFNPSFPSHLRNSINYPSNSCIYDLENSLPDFDLLRLQKNLEKSFLKIDPFNNSLSNQILAASYYSILAYYLMDSLYGEYKIRSKYNRDFQKEINDFVIKNHTQLLYM